MVNLCNYTCWKTEQIDMSGRSTVLLTLWCRHEKQLVAADQDMLALLNRIALYKQRSTMLFEVGSPGKLK